MTAWKHFSVQKWLQASLGGNILEQLHFPFYAPVLCLAAGLQMSRKSYGYNLICSWTLRPQQQKKSKPLYSWLLYAVCGGVWVGMRCLLDWNTEIFYYCVLLTLKFQTLNHGICMKCRAGLFAIQIFPYPAWPASLLMEVLLLWMKELQKWACHVRSPSTLADETVFQHDCHIAWCFVLYPLLLPVFEYLFGGSVNRDGL